MVSQLIYSILGYAVKNESFSPEEKAAIIGFFLVIFLFLTAGWWIYTSFAWSSIARKLKYKKDWLAWIPFARGAMILQLGEKFSWKWIFLYLIPVLGWITVGILLLISMWIIYEKRGYPGWLSLLVLLSFAGEGIGFAASIADWVVLGLVAWKDRPTNKRRK